MQKKKKKRQPQKELITVMYPTKNKQTHNQKKLATQFFPLTENYKKKAQQQSFRFHSKLS